MHSHLCKRFNSEKYTSTCASSGRLVGWRELCTFIQCTFYLSIYPFLFYVHVIVCIGRCHSLFNIDLIQPGNLSLFVLDTTKSFTTLKLEEKNETSLHITWIHPYPECKQFTVYLDGKPLVNVTKNTSYTITGLTPATKYNVTVVAMEDPLPIQVISTSFLTPPGKKRVDWYIHACITAYHLLLLTMSFAFGIYRAWWTQFGWTQKHNCCCGCYCNFHVHVGCNITTWLYTSACNRL